MSSFNNDNRRIHGLQQPANKGKVNDMASPLRAWRTQVRKRLPPHVADAYYRWRFRHLDEAKLIVSYVDPRRAAIDVGANRGAVTQLLAQHCPFVYAYEPNPRARASLSRRLSDNVTVYPYAVSDEAGTIDLVEPVWDGEVSHAHGSITRNYEGSEVNRTSIEAVRLDEMGHSVHDIGFIKIDVEGHELAAVDGAANLLATARPTLWIEMDGYGYPGGMASGIAKVESYGYRGYFHIGTKRYSADLFSERVFQPRNLETGGHLAGYISNFLFLPR